MKRINYFAMSLLASAALAFTGCSSEDVINGNTENNEAVDGYYMTLTVKTPKATGTRTVQDGATLETGTQDENFITNGTIYVYDGNTCVFRQKINATDWVQEDGTYGEWDKDKNEGTTRPIKVSVNGVVQNKTYQVYFLANVQDGDTKYPNPLGTNTTIDGKAADCSGANKFYMFNQYDNSKELGHSTVVFTEESRNENQQVHASTIYLDRVVARVDAPNTTNATTIKQKDNTTTTKNITDIVDKVEFSGYALSNLSTKSYLVQNWATSSSTPWKVNIPNDNSYDKTSAYYGTTYKAENEDNWAITTNEYVFENAATTPANATSMYFKFKVTLKEPTGTQNPADFTDGTFYRYNHTIYRSLKDLLAVTQQDNSQDVWPFMKEDNSGVAMTAEEAIALFKDANGNLKSESELESLRSKYLIEVYRGGMAYYKQIIEDQYNTFTATNQYSILRNSVYKLTVNNIWDLGKDVPNGPDPTDEYYYWMDVTVTVNPWVVSNQTVDLQ